MSYSAALEFLQGLQNHGIKLGLESIQALLGRLGNPQDRYRTIHIGGTNGKGSTAAMAAAMLQAAGYQVGLYTSPHLIDFRERIRINGDPIPDDSVSQLTDHVRAALRDTIGKEILPTFFEFTTALAFQHFAEAGVDVAVIEVGLGGRFDATNTVQPMLSVITNVALDHQEYLGDNVGAIAFEKAGIIKDGVPVVAGRLSAEAAEVVEAVATDRGAPIFRLARDFRVAGDPLEGFHYEGVQRSYRDLSSPLAGLHQLDNAACALAALELASDLGLPASEQAIRDGLRATQWEGRLEVVERHPTLLLDGAHNPAAAEAVAGYLASYRRVHPTSRVILIIGMMRDKDRTGFLRRLLPLADELVLTQASIPRAASVEELAAALDAEVGTAQTVPHPAEALALARRLASSEDLICVTGSLLLVGEMKALLRGCGLSPIRG
jgi:dihydrofolate synthase/folylpolyglutamate synthase